MARSPSVNTLVKDLEPDELREVISELCKLSKKNKQFLELYLQGSEKAAPEAVVEEARKKIYGCLYGRGLPKLDLRGGRNAVQEYSKVLKEYPQCVADLKLYYVEVGTQITEEYGDMYEGFYSSLASMFGSFCKDVKQQPALYSDFEQRIHALKAATDYMGWGYGDDISFLSEELEAAVIGEEGS